MGYTTDFVGHIDIEPALNQDETENLMAFSRSRRSTGLRGRTPCRATRWPSETSAIVDIDTYNRVAPGQPQLWCQWVPCLDGCCLAFNGHEKFYEPVAWMRYLIQHFLKPGAAASKSGLPAFEHFTFDHRLDGLVVGCRRDTKELFAIEVKSNRVTERVLRPGLSEFGGTSRWPTSRRSTYGKRAVVDDESRRSMETVDVVDLGIRRGAG